MLHEPGEIRRVEPLSGERRVTIHTSQWMESAQRLDARIGFERAPHRDVPYTSWNSPEIKNLLAEWIGVPFLGFVWPPTTGA